MAATSRVILGIDPGLAHTGWGIVEQNGSRLACVAYGCVTTDAQMTLDMRLVKLYDQISAVIGKYRPACVGIETVWFGQNITSAFATGQARGAVLVACGKAGLKVGEFTPNQIKLAVVGVGHAEKEQVEYMVQKILRLEAVPHPDHAADALAAALCFTSQGAECPGGETKFEAAVSRALAKEEARARDAREKGQARARGAREKGECSR